MHKQTEWKWKEGTPPTHHEQLAVADNVLPELLTGLGVVGDVRLDASQRGSQADDAVFQSLSLLLIGGHPGTAIHHGFPQLPALLLQHRQLRVEHLKKQNNMAVGMQLQYL